MNIRKRFRAIRNDLRVEMEAFNEVCDRDDPHISGIACVFIVVFIVVDSVLTHGFDA